MVLLSTIYTKQIKIVNYFLVVRADHKNLDCINKLTKYDLKIKSKRFVECLRSF